MGNLDTFSPSDDTDASFDAPVVSTGKGETPQASPDHAIASPTEIRASLDAVLSGLPADMRADFLARFDALDPTKKNAAAAELSKLRTLLESGQVNDGVFLLEKILPAIKQEVRNIRDSDPLGELKNAIGLDRIKASPAYAAAEKKITPKTHPDPERREAAMTAYAILHDPELQTVARQNLGEAKANDLIADLQRQFPEPKNIPISVEPRKAAWTRREEGQFQALGGDMKQPVERVADAYTFTNDKGHRMRLDTSSTPPIVSRIDERMGGVAAEVRAAPYESVHGAETVLASIDMDIRRLEHRRDATAQNIAAAAARFQMPTSSDDTPEKIGDALDAALAIEEQKAGGNAASFAIDPKIDPFESSAELAALEPPDPAAGKRFSDARTALAGLRETLKETTATLEEARTRKQEAEAFRDRVLATYKASLEEANEQTGRNLDHFNDAGGRFLGPDGLKAVFDTVNENIGFRRILGLPSAFDLSTKLDEGHHRAFARIMTEIIGEDLFDPMTHTLKKERVTEDKRTVSLDDGYIREKLQARGIVSADGS